MNNPQPDRTRANTGVAASWEYRDARRSPTDGVMTGLAADLLPVVPYDHLRLAESRRGAIHRIAIHLRQAGKRVFHVRLIRRGGRLLVQLGGLDPTRVLAGVHVCRNHFDRWFGITPIEIEAMEPRPNSSPSAPEDA